MTSDKRVKEVKVTAKGEIVTDAKRGSDEDKEGGKEEDEE